MYSVLLRTRENFPHFTGLTLAPTPFTFHFHTRQPLSCAAQLYQGTGPVATESGHIPGPKLLPTCPRTLPPTLQGWTESQLYPWWPWHSGHSCWIKGWPLTWNGPISISLLGDSDWVTCVNPWRPLRRVEEGKEPPHTQAAGTKTRTF